MAETESIEQFRREFNALKNYAPYPWQERLYAAFTNGNLPDALDIPTGLGKTTVIDIWLLAHLLGDPANRPPMRLVYVVNRRTIVDQATDAADELAKAIVSAKSLQSLWMKRFDADSEAKLAISTLRGAKADSGDWLLAPHRPAIVVGTVDMIGSRLLFNGYRTGHWQRARHAGLLGYDSLLVHDEAHLSRPFQKLVEWVRSKQSKDDRHAMRLLPMSATSATGKNVLRITADDRRHAGAKLRAGKRMVLHAGEKLDPKQLAALAVVHRDAQARVIVFVREPRVAASVIAEIKNLHKTYGDPLTGGRIELLTGTIRGHERDKLVGQPVLRHLLKGWGTDAPRTEYLVSTSAGEVGADFDGDHLICDLSTIDAMIQRVGRVNRRGRDGHVATIDVVVDRPVPRKASQKLSDVDEARLACATFLESLKAEQGDAIDASPEAITGKPDEHLAGWRQRAGYAAACDPEVPTIEPHPAVLDAWSLTSIQDKWPLAHDVEPYLHGEKDDAPQTVVAWRAELDELDVPTGGEVDQIPVRDILKHYPLRPQEQLQDKPARVAELLRTAHTRFGNKLVVFIDGRQVRVCRLSELPDDPKRLENDVRNRTIVLPVSVGGLNDKGMIEPISDRQADSVAPVPDVADRQEVKRARVLLWRDDEEQWHGRPVPATSDFTVDFDGAASFGRWTEARDVWARRLKMRYAARVILSTDELGASRMLLLFAVRDTALTTANRLTIVKHNQDVADMADERATGLDLPNDSHEARAIRFAAAHHDLGKADDNWQRSVGNKPGEPAVAKSLGKGMNTQLLNGYRHEFGSLIEVVVKGGAFGALDESARDLALHLIAAHHGRGRPHFTTEAMKLSVDALPPELRPAEVARRFDRLQRHYGHWGLAWLESVLMSADVQASKNHSVLMSGDVQASKNHDADANEDIEAEDD